MSTRPIFKRSSHFLYLLHHLFHNTNINLTMADQLTESQLSEFKGNFLCSFSDMYIYEQIVAGERRRTKKTRQGWSYPRF